MVMVLITYLVSKILKDKEGKDTSHPLILDIQKL